MGRRSGRAVVKAAMNVRVPQSMENFFTTRRAVSFSWRILHRGVGYIEPVELYCFWQGNVPNGRRENTVFNLHFGGHKY
jgi:hypothetical protein